MTQTENTQETVESSVEDDFWAALTRLKNKLSSGQAVQISFKAVAEEAGRSRTLIGYNGCPYPEVRKAVGQAIIDQKRLKTPHSSTTSAAQATKPAAPKKVGIEDPDLEDPSHRIANLKGQVKELTRRNKVAAIKIVTIDDENQQLREEIDRLKTELKRRRSVPSS
jgi:hypothetical protein